MLRSVLLCLAAMNFAACVLADDLDLSILAPLSPVEAAPVEQLDLSLFDAPVASAAKEPLDLAMLLVEKPVSATKPLALKLLDDCGLECACSNCKCADCVKNRPPPVQTAQTGHRNETGYPGLYQWNDGTARKEPQPGFNYPTVGVFYYTTPPGNQVVQTLYQSQWRCSGGSCYRVR